MDDHTAGAADGPVDRTPPIGQLTRHTPAEGAKSRGSGGRLDGPSCPPAFAKPINPAALSLQPSQPTNSRTAPPSATPTPAALSHVKVFAEPAVPALARTSRALMFALYFPARASYLRSESP
jgi:hypothetical protein